jgi:fumarylacetoacetate (FAA) hydrolase
MRDNLIYDVAEALAMSVAIPDVKALLELGAEAVDRVRQWVPGSVAGHRLEQLRLLPPVLLPPTIRDYSVYAGHASMNGAWQLPESWYRLPVFYFSNPLCVYGQEAEIPFPSATQKFDFEVELAAVIGKEGRNIAAKDAFDYIAGFTIFIDWSSRDLQRDEMQLHLGPAKGKDSASSFGPWVVTIDELASARIAGEIELSVTMDVNGQNWVSGTTKGMQHDWAALIERASRDSRIVPGDIIGAGTINGGSIPEAIRLGKPARYLQPGDVLEARMDGIGILRTKLGPKDPCPADYMFLPPAK